MKLATPSADDSQAAAITRSVSQLMYWRTRVLDVILVALSVLGFFAVISATISTFEDFASKDALPQVISYVIGYGLLLVATTVRRLGYAIRVGVVLVLLFGFAALGLFASGLSGDGRLFTFAFITMAAIFAPRRLVFAAMAAGLILLSVTAWLFVTGQVVVPLNVQANSAQGSAWASGLVTFLLLNGIVVLSLSYLISQLEQSLSLAFASAEAATEAASKADAQAQASVAQAERLAQVERDLRELVATLELPTIPIADRMLLAPLVGPVDLPRAQALQGRLLSQVVARGADTVVIDLSGARTADSSVADGLIQLVESLRLVGSTAVFTGLTPEMALEITGHIRDQRAFVTARSPQDALEQARRESPLP